MKMESLNEPRQIDQESVRERLLEEVEERLELACWVDHSCGANLGTG